MLREIIEKEAVAWSVTAVDAKEIDEMNILNASITGMQRSVGKLKTRPEFLLIDGNRFKTLRRHPLQDHCRRRRKIRLHRGGFRPGQDLS